MNNFNLPEFGGFPKLINDIPALGPLKEIKSAESYHYASAFHERLTDYIVNFENNLTDHEELALKLVSFGETVTIIVEQIGYYNPSLISFSGRNFNSERVQLVQHVSQISFLLMAVKTREPVEPRQRIGFKLKHEQEKNTEK